MKSTELLEKASFPFVLAPMVGLSHVALRLLVRSYMPQNSAALWPTEMLSTRRLPSEKVGQTPETFRSESEAFLVPQILGNEERFISESIDRLTKWGASGIDINMGCPVKKALQHNWGVALMGDANYASQVVAMTRRSTQLPVSVKLRAGIDHDTEYLIDFIQQIRDAGADWITLHPRLASQMRRGNADWDLIRLVRERIKIPVFGNGDVQTVEDALKMREETGCERVVIGRALTARPWMVWQLGERLGYRPPEGRTESAPTTDFEEGAEYGRALETFVNHCRNYFAENLGLRKIKFFVRTGSVWLEFGNTLYGVVDGAKTYDEVIEGVRTFFKSPQRMYRTTTLRH